MSALPEHPSLVLAVTPHEREAAIQRLRTAYAEGTITAADLNLRLGMATMAQSRRDLNTAFLGLVEVTPDDVRRHTAVASGRGLAVAAHVSGWFFFLVGPLVCYAVAPQGSYARREAAKAVNLAVLTLAGLAVALIVALIKDSVGVPLGFLVAGCWWLTSLVAAIQAGKGNDWQHPLKRWLSFEALREQ